MIIMIMSLSPSQTQSWSSVCVVWFRNHKPKLRSTRHLTFITIVFNMFVFLPHETLCVEEIHIPSLIMSYSAKMQLFMSNVVIKCSLRTWVKSDVWKVSFVVGLLLCKQAVSFRLLRVKHEVRFNTDRAFTNIYVNMLSIQSLLSSICMCLCMCSFLCRDRTSWPRSPRSYERSHTCSWCPRWGATN